MRGVTHSVEVAASSLYEAAALALGAFRSSDFAGRIDPRAVDRLTVAVKVEEARHEVRVGDLDAWLACSGRSPREQALKIRLRQTLTEAVWEERR
jgi:hypothetical protein